MVSWKDHRVHVSATVWGVALTRRLAVQYGGAPAEVNADVPELILSAAWDETADANLAALAAGTAPGRLATAEDVATALAVLASPQASHVTTAQLAGDAAHAASAVGK